MKPELYQFPGWVVHPRTLSARQEYLLLEARMAWRAYWMPLLSRCQRVFQWLYHSWCKSADFLAAVSCIADRMMVVLLPHYTPLDASLLCLA